MKILISVIALVTTLSGFSQDKKFETTSLKLEVPKDRSEMIWDKDIYALSKFKINKTDRKGSSINCSLESTVLIIDRNIYNTQKEFTVSYDEKKYVPRINTIAIKRTIEIAADEKLLTDVSSSSVEIDILDLMKKSPSKWVHILGETIIELCK